jgi:hypothetical protein
MSRKLIDGIAVPVPHGLARPVSNRSSRASTIRSTPAANARCNHCGPRQEPDLPHAELKGFKRQRPLVEDLRAARVDVGVHAQPVQGYTWAVVEVVLDRRRERAQPGLVADARRGLKELQVYNAHKFDAVVRPEAAAAGRASQKTLGVSGSSRMNCRVLPLDGTVKGAPPKARMSMTLSA